MKNLNRILLLLPLFIGLLLADVNGQTAITVGGSNLPTNGNMAAGVTAAGVPVPILVLADGTVAVTGGGGGGGGTSSNFGAAFPAAGTASGFKDSTGVNMTFGKVNASNALLVDGSAVTQPVSIAATLSSNVAQLAGTTTDTNSGNKSAGTLRVVLATDQPNFTTPINTSDVAVQDLFITGQGAQTVSGNNIVLASAGTAAVDVSAYRSVSVEIVPTGTVSSGVVTFEASNDNTNFVALPLYDEASLTANPISTVSPATGVFRFFTGPCPWRYFRARISTVIGGGGSIQGFTRFTQAPFTPDQYTVTQATAANLQTTATIASGTVTTVSTVTTLANGQTAHSAASTGSPVRVGGRVNTTLDTSLVQGDASDLFVSTSGQLVEKPYSTAENDWQYATPIASPITTTTGVAIKAAGAASIRNYVTGIQMMNTSATASIVTLQDGAAVVWTGYLPASMTTMINVTFPTPIKGSAATAMNFVVNTTSTNTFVSAQGYQSF